MAPTGKAFCFIPAKAGSTRLPGKNLRSLAGKSLLERTIATVKQSGRFSAEEVIVSTEDEETANVARAAGASTPYLRDPKLARDPYEVYHVLLDYLENHNSLGPAYTHCLLCLPTSPFLWVKDIEESHAAFLASGRPVLMSVGAAEKNGFRLSTLEEGLLTPIRPDAYHTPRPELPPTYYVNGAIAWITLEDFRAAGTYYVEPVATYVMPALRSVDIDTPEDFAWAEFLALHYPEKVLEKL